MKKTIIKFNIFAIIIIAIICFVMTPIELQNDTFYTIKIGEHILNNGIDMVDPFSWHADLPYTYPHWAYDVITYLIFNISGFNGLYIATLILSIILGLALYLAGTKISKNHSVSLLVTIVTMVLFKNYIAARAQLVTFILFVLTILFIERFLQTKKIKYAILLIIIPIIIANVHLAVWPFYFILFLPYIAEYIISIIYNAIRGKSDKTGKLVIVRNDNVKWLLLIFAISTLTGFLTPLGFTPYTYLIKTMQGTTTKSIAEHTPLVLFNRKAIIMVMLTFLGIFSFSKVKIKLSDLIMIIGLTLLALGSNRQVSMLLLIGSIIMIKLIVNLIDLQNEKFKSKYNKNIEQSIIEFITKKLTAIVIIITILLSAIAVFVITQKKEKYINETIYPVKAAEWIKENLDVKNIKLFNEYNYGSYLLYKDIPVFIDSRADLYTPEFNGKKGEDGNYVGKNIFDDFINLSSLSVYYKNKLDEYGITHIILQKNTKLNIMISNDNDYESIYSDDNFIIYEKSKI